MSKKPVSVLISDVHFTINTLNLAKISLTMALGKAEELDVPLVIAGDLNDTKAILRAECVNAIIGVLEHKRAETEVYVLIGNHDLINEKGNDHSLHFLDRLATVVSQPTWVETLKAWLVPYQSDAHKLEAFLKTVEYGSTLVMHQGVQTAYMGHYIQDKTSLPKDAFKDFRVISGHYHKVQNIKCGRPRAGGIGLFSYIGNPYSLSFGEASDGPKGFQVLFDDGLMEQIQTNLRKHIVIEWNVLEGPLTSSNIQQQDLVWIKASGPESELNKLDKEKIGQDLLGHSNFKLDLIKRDQKQLEKETKAMTDEQILDALIDLLDDEEAEKARLKALWREVAHENS